jgi:hypothetical protein
LVPEYHIGEIGFNISINNFIHKYPLVKVMKKGETSEEKDMMGEKYMNKFQVAILTILAVLVMCSASWAATYYVDATNGNDSNTGTSPIQAWRTLSKVNGQTFNAGDYIYFKRGEAWNETLYPDSGSSGNLITYGAYGSGNKPIIRNFSASTKSYIKVQDIEFKSNGGDYPVYLTNSHHIRIESCKIYGNTSCTRWCAFYMTLNSNHNELITCDIAHRNLSIQTDAVNLNLNSNYNLIKENTIGSATHCALSLMGSTSTYPTYTCDYNVIKDNIIVNNDGGVVSLLSNSNNNLVEGNTIAGGKSTPFCRNSPRSFKLVTMNNIVRNNVICDNTPGSASGLTHDVYQYSADPRYPPNIASGNRVYNNLITNIGRCAVSFTNYSPEAGSNVENNHWKNNIVCNNGTDHQLTIWGGAYGINIQDNYFKHNVFYKSGVSNILYIRGAVRTVAQQEATESTYWSGNIQQAPDLDGDYRPLSGSPCIDAGDFLTEVTSATGSGTTFTVSDARYFTDGLGIIQGDTIRVGNTTATIETIDYGTNTIILRYAISWQKGHPVSLPYNGAKPDIGAFEYASGTSSSQYYEAETMDLTSPMALGNDTNASGGQYVSLTSGEGSTIPLPEATSEFTVSETGTYYLWIRMMGPDSSSDALYVGIDTTWDRAYPSSTGTYEWVRVETSHNSENYGFNLTAGNHTFQIGHGEINARADALFLTDDLDEMPPSVTTSIAPPNGLRIVSSN